MFPENTWGRSVDILRRSMSVNLFRQDTIANNIANVDTPNFKRTDVNYESSLRQALVSEQNTRTRGVYTNEKHIPFERTIDYRTVRPRRVLDFMTTSKNNGNNVDIEVESSNFITAQLAYNLMVNSVSHHFNSVNIVLRG
jgi:flagellar basal-body rod protein FlgB